MPCHLTVPDDLPIIEAVYVGALTVAELNAKNDEILALIARHGRYLMLADCAKFLGTENTLMDMHVVAEELSHNPLAARVKEAVIVPDAPEGAEIVQFWEMICRNRGIMVRSFADRASALEWLLAGNGQ